MAVSAILEMRFNNLENMSSFQFLHRSLDKCDIDDYVFLAQSKKYCLLEIANEHMLHCDSLLVLSTITTYKTKPQII